MDTNTILVDKSFDIKGGSIVGDKNNLYTCTLNQTNIEDNKNKFYIIQLIKVGNNYHFFKRFGRTGETGKPSSESYASLSIAILDFEKQFKTKTGNKWSERNNFVKKAGKYFMADISYDIKIVNKDLLVVQAPPSKLTDRVQKLIELISNKDMMEKFLIKMNVDVKKAPLGKISTKQIDKAIQILQKIKTDNFTNATDQSSEFYTLIPYACGRRKPPVIDTQDKVSVYDELLDDLKNMVIAVEILDNANANTKMHPTDNIYQSLNTNINALDKKSAMWNHIDTYVKNTHAPTHNFKVELMDIYEITRDSEKDIYSTYTANMDNRMLLFHGSRLSNFCSIFQKGLILNPESLGVYISGKMFGSGLYLSDTFSKSMGYTASETSNNIAGLLLCEVALGIQAKKTQADYYISKKSLEKEGCESTWGQGQYSPSSYIEVDGVKIPNGKLSKSGINSVLLYNEMIIYDSRQMHVKYLVVVKKV